MRRHFKTVDEYIGTFSPETQVILQKVRQIIREVAPKATEKISYNIPSFQLNGTYLIYYAGYEKHISLYPIISGDETFNKEIAPYIKGKGTIQFQLNKPIPYELIRKIVMFKHEENQFRKGKSYGK